LEPVTLTGVPADFIPASASCTIGIDAAIADVSRIALMNSIDVIFRVIELKG
jgi:hypothetical protein